MQTIDLEFRCELVLLILTKTEVYLDDNMVHRHIHKLTTVIG